MSKGDENAMLFKYVQTRTAAERFAELKSLILPRIAKIRNHHPQVAVRGDIDELQKVHDVVVSRRALYDKRITVEFLCDAQIQFTVRKLLEFNNGECTPDFACNPRTEQL